MLRTPCSFQRSKVVCQIRTQLLNSWPHPPSSTPIFSLISPVFWLLQNEIRFFGELRNPKLTLTELLDGSYNIRPQFLFQNNHVTTHFILVALQDYFLLPGLFVLTFLRLSHFGVYSEHLFVYSFTLQSIILLKNILKTNR